MRCGGIASDRPGDVSHSQCTFGRLPYSYLLVPKIMSVQANWHGQMWRHSTHPGSRLPFEDGASFDMRRSRLAHAAILEATRVGATGHGFASSRGMLQVAGRERKTAPIARCHAIGLASWHALVDRPHASTQGHDWPHHMLRPTARRRAQGEVSSSRCLSC